MELEYDSCGRLKYNPSIHFNQGKIWDKGDLQYLIDWLDKIGIEEMSFALGRTEGSLIRMATWLRKEGMMSPQRAKIKHPRLLRREVLSINA